MNRRHLFFRIFIVLIFITLCSLFAFGSLVQRIKPGADKRTATAHVFVFADLNGDGKQGKDEPPLSNSLVLAKTNVHGWFSQSSALTDEKGEATIQADYTHYFDVRVLPPCGYTPTTPIVQPSVGVGPFAKQVFGFQPVPELSQPGAEMLTFQLWQDANLDGIWQEEERPLSNIQLSFAPDWEGTYHATEFDDNTFSTTTDETGHATFNVGNSCGRLLAAPLPDWNTTTFDPGGSVHDDGEIEFGYDAQTDAFTWGVTTYRHFKFSTGTAHHPEGMGAWEINLDTEGVFRVKQIVFDEITKYGPYTLAATENQALWQLISDVNIEELPHTFERPGIPDETAHTFTLQTVNNSFEVEMWVTDAEQNPALQTLVDQIFTHIETYTGVAQ